MGQAGERLPWLNDEPVPQPASVARAPLRQAAPPRSTARAMWPFYLLLLLLVAAVAGGAWWLGTQQRDASPSQLPVEEPVAIPVTEVTEAPTPAVPPELAASEPAPATPSRQGASDQPRTAEAAPPRERPAPQPAPTGGREEAEASGRGVFPADEPATAALPATGPQPIVVYHPQPNRGRVVQLGAFPTRAQAEQAWRRVTRRYPYLSTKPKMVNTVEVRSVGGGRKTRMYRLQLGTSSQAQSAVICQQLERAGQSCVVVY